MADDDKTLNVKLKFTPDQSSAGGAQKSSEKVTDALKKTQQQAKATADEIGRLKQKAESLQRIGTMAGMAGAAILGSFTLAARNYAQYAGVAEATSRNWLATNRRLEQANLRLGRAAATALTPWIEKLADVAEKFSEIAESQPGLVNTVLAIGGVAAGLGALTTTVAQLLQGLAALKNLGILSTLGGILGKLGISLPMVGAGVATTALAGLAQYGLVKAQETSEGFLSKILGPDLAKSSTQGAFSGLSAIFRNPLINFPVFKKLFGEKEPGATAGNNGSTKSNSIISDQAVRTYIAYTKASAEADKAYAQDRQRIVEQAGKAINDLERNYSRERAKIESDFQQQQAQEAKEFALSQSRSLRDFYKSEQQTEQDYYAERAKRAADYGREVERVEAEHQKNLRRMQEDHNRRVDNLLTAGDARGLEQEMYDYETERQRSEEDYGDAARQRDQDFARELTENEQQFQQERARRMEEFNVRMQDEANDFIARRQQAIEQYNEMKQERDEQYQEELAAIREKKEDALRELDTQYGEERSKRAEAFDQQMADLGVFLQNSADWWGSYYQWHADQLRKMMGGGLGGMVNGARDSGGYVSAGKWQMHNGEYVLTRATTNALENMAGGLTQDKILSMAAGKGGWSGGKEGVTYNDQRRIYARELSANDWRTMRETALDALDEIMR